MRTSLWLWCTHRKIRVLGTIHPTMRCRWERQRSKKRSLFQSLVYGILPKKPMKIENIQLGKICTDSANLKRIYFDFVHRTIITLIFVAQSLQFLLLDSDLKYSLIHRYFNSAVSLFKKRIHGKIRFS